MSGNSAVSTPAAGMAPGQLARRLRWLARQLFPEWRVLAAALACLALAAATEPAQVWLIKTAVDWGAGGPAGLRYWMLPCMVILIYLVRGLAAFGTAHLIGGVCARLVQRLQARLYRHLMDAHQQPTDGGAGTAVHLIIFEIKQCSDLIERVFTKLLRHVLTLCSLFIYLVCAHWRLGLLAALALPAAAWVCVMLGRRLALRAREQVVLNESLAEMVIERSAMAAVIKLHGTQRDELLKFEHVTAAARRCVLRLYMVVAAAPALTQLIMATGFGLCIAWLAFQTSDGALSSGEAAALLASLLLLLTPLKNLAELNGPILRSLVGMNQVLGLLEMPVLPAGGQAVQALQGRLECRDVYFAHAGRQQQPVLAGISFGVQAGESVAIVGPSGAGKSTLLNLLMGQDMPDSGEILLDGQPLRQFQVAALRSQMAVVSQDIGLRRASILHNIAYGDAVPDLERAGQAICAAQLQAVVSALPDGMHSVLGAEGVGLSGGQRQQLAIARALYRQVPILLLDETTAALDEESERLVGAALAALKGRCTTLMVSHRLATLEFADRVIFLEQGRIAASGRHQDLLCSCPAYAGLFADSLSAALEAGPR